MIYIRRVNGNSMLPTYKNRQVVIVSHIKKPYVGCVVVAVQNGKEVMKRIESIDKNKMIELRGDNPDYSTDSRQHGKIPMRMVLGVVIWPKG